MIRLLQAGKPAQSLRCSFEATAGGIFALGGGGDVPAGSSLTVNGKISNPATPVKPGDTVALQPNPNHG